MNNFINSILLHIKKLLELFEKRNWDIYSIGMIVLYIVMLFCVGVFIFSLIKYFKDYKVFTAIRLRLTGQIKEYDRIRRLQLRKEMEEKNEAFYETKKTNLVSKLYQRIAMSGIVERIPGFSESAFCICIGLLDIIIFFIVLFSRNVIVALAIVGAVLFVEWYGLSVIVYNRKVKLEEQLLQFANACASASSQYTSLIDIFGAIYEQFHYPLKKGLERCYIEAKQTNDKNAAIRHLKEKYDSAQFVFIIDNLQTCSKITGDFRSAAKDIVDIISIFSQSHKKKQAIVRNAKINILVMSILSLLILLALSLFLGGITDVLINSTIGNILIIIFVLILFKGFTMKTEK